MGDFIGEATTKKVVMLEELGETYGLGTQEIADRIKSLEAMGRISGVFDDRGKFIYISKEEMSKVAAFIMKRGRISIS